MSTEVSFPGGQSSRSIKQNIHLHLVNVLKYVELRPKNSIRLYCVALTLSFTMVHFTHSAINCTKETHVYGHEVRENFIDLRYISP
jgi:hypothetical protein